MLSAAPAPFLGVAPLGLALGGPALAAGFMFVWLLVRLFRDQGPDPAETAISYELAWDRLDFSTLWRLSAPALREGRTRDRFLTDQRGAYSDGRQWRNLVVRAIPDEAEIAGESARVMVRLALRNGDSLVDEVLLDRSGGPWRVASCRLVEAGHPG
ncbi:MAG: hypothetical protein ACRDV9_12265 [Acidimicrobiia bacterium]